MRSCGLALVTALAALACTTAALAAAPPPTTETFVDATGDSGTAPDIAKVSVATDGAAFTFTVSFATAYGTASTLYVTLSTGTAGTDFRLGPQGLQSKDASAADWSAPDGTSTFAVASDGMTATLTVPASAIGAPKAFDLLVQSLDDGGGAGHQDIALGHWQPAVPKKLALTVSSTLASPPVRGGTWTLVVVANRSDTLTPVTAGKVTCKATAGRAKLKVSAKLSSSAALCLVKLPKTHASLRAVVTVSTGGASVSHTFTARV